MLKIINSAAPCLLFLITLSPLHSGVPGSDSFCSIVIAIRALTGCTIEIADSITAVRGIRAIADAQVELASTRAEVYLRYKAGTGKSFASPHSV